MIMKLMKNKIKNIILSITKIIKHKSNFNFEENNSLDRSVAECIWYHVMLKKYQEPNEFYENEVFAIKPYDWVKDNNDWHFWHKPSGVKIYWYKYPLRGFGINKRITYEQLYAILQDAMNSTPERNGKVKVTYVIDEWWK